MAEAVKFPVFRDDSGNRFLFPGLYTYQDRKASWERCLEICLALNVTEEDEPFEVVPDENGMANFTRVTATATHSAFAHGGSEVWIIGGPKFDEVEAAESVSG